MARVLTISLLCAMCLCAGSFFRPTLRAIPRQGADVVPAGGRSVWDSVYSHSQAEAGKRVYTESCGRCHAADLSGGHAPGLRGSKFLVDWGAGSLARLFARTKALMPQDSPGSLSDQDYLALVAYILEVNEFPAGETSLAVQDLDQIRVYGKEGPAFVPEFAMVNVVACLAKAADNSWVLTNSSAPAMTLNPKASTGDELKAAVERPLGTDTFSVIDAVPAPNPASAGQKVEAKGFLMRNPRSGISITSLETIGVACGK